MADKLAATTRRSALVLGLVAGTSLLTSPLPAAVRRAGLANGDEAQADAAIGFDFLIGDWRVRHRKLKRRLAGDTTWFEFPGTLSVRKILGGRGNIDENVLDDPAGRYEASSLRLFNPEAGQWSIYWIDARNPSVDPPVIGRFENGLGSFYNDDLFEKRPIRVRFTYQSLTARTAQWTQAFSADAGENWETNWIMDFTRD